MLTVNIFVTIPDLMFCTAQCEYILHIEMGSITFSLQNNVPGFNYLLPLLFIKTGKVGFYVEYNSFILGIDILF